MKQHVAIAALVGVAAACLSAPQLAPVTRTPLDVAASFERTWQAAVDMFTEQNIPIRTIDRASGLIATDGLNVPVNARSTSWADCGRSGGAPIRPTAAVYNVLVRGDSSHTTIRVTTRWVALTRDPLTWAWQTVECVSTGKWEDGAEADVKARAEQRE